MKQGFAWSCAGSAAAASISVRLARLPAERLGSFFQKIRTGPNNLEEERNLVAFLAWAARNKVIDRYRRAAGQRRDITRERPLPHETGGGRDLVEGGASPSEMAEAHELYGRLHALLPEDRRVILELKAAGYSSREIGDRVGVSERTVQRVLEDLKDRARIED